MSFAFTVTVKDEPRRSRWLEYLGTDTLPIINGLPILANVPGHPETRVYLVDFWTLDEDMQFRLVKMLAACFGWKEMDVWMELGLRCYAPILAEGAIVDVCDGEVRVDHER